MMQPSCSVCLKMEAAAQLHHQRLSVYLSKQNLLSIQILVRVFAVSRVLSLLDVLYQTECDCGSTGLFHQDSLCVRLFDSTGRTSSVLCDGRWRQTLVRINM